MKVILLVSSIVACGFGCSRNAEQAPGQEDETTEVAAPAEAPRSPAGDHRLQLGIDGDPGYAQQELSPEELAKVRAEGEQAPAPSYPEQSDDPSQARQAPSETEAAGQPSEAEEGENPYYGYGERDALYRERERERVRRDDLDERSPTAHPEEAAREVGPVERPRVEEAPRRR